MHGLVAVLTAVFTALLRVVLPWVARQSRPTAQDADADRKLAQRLRAKVRRHWLIVACVLPLVLTGCGGGSPFTRTVYVPHGTPVRLRATIKDAPVWVKDAEGRIVAGRMDLPEGWYALPVPTDDQE
jgi:hypothetical protein